MRQPTDNTPGQKPTLGNTLFLGGICILFGAVALLIGLGVIPSGNVEHTSSSRLLSAGAGMLFVFLGAMVFVRDFGGARNNGDMPANAPRALRIGERILSIALIAVFAAICSLVALDAPQDGGAGGTFFRIIMGCFAVALWFAAAGLAISRMRKRA